MALQFDGTSYLKSINNLGLTGSPTFSYGGWVKLGLAFGDGNAFCWIGTGGSAYKVGAWAWYSSFAPTELYYIRWSLDIPSIEHFALNTWYHLYFTNDGANAYVYLNGVEYGPFGNGSWNLGDAPIWFGSGNQTWYPPQPCTMADWRIYNRVLSSTEVGNIFTGAGVDGITSGITARWKMNEKTSGYADTENSVLDTAGTNHCNPTSSPMYVADPFTPPITTRRFFKSHIN